MAFKLNRFKIEKLHGHCSYDIPLNDGQLILVAENGSGKTTIINILYYTLSCQWEKLARYNFHRVTIEIGGQSISLTKEMVEGFRKTAGNRGRLQRMLPPSRRNLLRERLQQLSFDEILEPGSTHIAALAEELRISPSVIFEYVSSVGGIREVEDAQTKIRQLAAAPCPLQSCPGHSVGAGGNYRIERFVIRRKANRLVIHPPLAF